MFGSRLFGGRAASLPPCLAPACLPAPFLRALCSAVHVQSINDDEHVGKGIHVYSHFSQKENRAYTCFALFFLVSDFPSLCY
jgi:hypothetical protein